MLPQCHHPLKSAWFPFPRFLLHFLTNWHRMHTQSCLTLRNPMDSSLPGSSVHGIIQARILECVAISSSRGSSRPGNQTRVSYVSCIVSPLVSTAPPGKPFLTEAIANLAKVVGIRFNMPFSIPFSFDKKLYTVSYLLLAFWFKPTPPQGWWGHFTGVRWKPW